MKKLLYLFIALFLLTCSSDDDGDGCKCQGEFTNDTLFPDTFFVDNVDCETGEPFTSQNNDTFFGCND